MPIRCYFKITFIRIILLLFIIIIGNIFGFIQPIMSLDQSPSLISKNPSNDQTNKPWLGINSIKVSQNIANLIGMNKPQGLLVIDVIVDSPADKSGIKGGYMTYNDGKYSIKLGGDIILAVDNHSLTESEESLPINKKIGENITLTVIRDGKIKQITTTLESRPNSLIYKNISCGKYSPFKNLQTKSLADYTVMVYVTSSELQDYAIKDLMEMKKIGNFSKLNILLQTGGGATIDNNPKTSIDFSQNQRFQIVNNTILTLQNIGHQNMGDSNTLCNFLVWGINHFPAKKYVTIFWGHGNGIKGFGKDITFNKDILTLQEIESSFRNAKEITQQKFELIGFDSCLMSSIEIAKRISPFANYMVSSEEIEPGGGWNYTSIFKSLIINPDQNGYLLGRVISDSYFNSFEKLPENKGFNIQKLVTLSVIDLTKIPQFEDSLSRYISHIVDNIKDISKVLEILNVTEKIERYGKSFDSSSGLIDIKSLISNLNRVFPDFRNLGDIVYKQLDESIVYNVTGEEKINSKGLSIYMPKIVEEISKYYTNTVPVRRLLKHFIGAFFQIQRFQ